MATGAEVKLKATLDTSDVQRKLADLRRQQQAIQKQSGQGGGQTNGLGAAKLDTAKLESAVSRLNSTISNLQKSIERLNNGMQRNTAQMSRQTAVQPQRPVVVNGSGAGLGAAGLGAAGLGAASLAGLGGRTSSGHIGSIAADAVRDDLKRRFGYQLKRANAGNLNYYNVLSRSETYDSLLRQTNDPLVSLRVQEARAIFEGARPRDIKRAYRDPNSQLNTWLGPYGNRRARISRGGPYAALGAMAGGMLLNDVAPMVSDNNKWMKATVAGLGGAMSGFGAGAFAGGLVGAAFGGAGAVPGAIIGGSLGAIGSGVSAFKSALDDIAAGVDEFAKKMNAVRDRVQASLDMQLEAVNKTKTARSDNAAIERMTDEQVRAEVKSREAAAKESQLQYESSVTASAEEKKEIDARYKALYEKADGSDAKKSIQTQWTNEVTQLETAMKKAREAAEADAVALERIQAEDEKRSQAAKELAQAQERAKQAQEAEAKQIQARLAAVQSQAGATLQSYADRTRYNNEAEFLNGLDGMSPRERLAAMSEHLKDYRGQRKTYEQEAIAFASSAKNATDPDRAEKLLKSSEFAEGRARSLDGIVSMLESSIQAITSDAKADLTNVTSLGQYGLGMGEVNDNVDRQMAVWEEQRDLTRQIKEIIQDRSQEATYG